MVTDHRAVTALPNTQSQVSISRHISQLGAPYTTFGIATGLYLFGTARDNNRLRETGLMATEALIHANLVMSVLKLASGRQRPLEGTGTGRFWSLGHESFPSGHAMAAWSLASVVAHEYSDNKFVPIAAYGLAGLVSASRIGARKHFPSDVLAGSVIGYLLGRYVYRTHEADAAHHALRTALTPEIASYASPETRGVGVSLTWNLRSH